jgi:hypothetical protein
VRCNRTSGLSLRVIEGFEGERAITQPRAAVTDNWRDLHDTVRCAMRYGQPERALRLVVFAIGAKSGSQTSIQSV